MLVGVSSKESDNITLFAKIISFLIDFESKTRQNCGSNIWVVDN